MYSQLLHSHLLQSLGSAIIHSLWQSLLLLVIYKAIVSLKKDLTPAVKHNLSAIFVILTFGWFVFTFQQKYFAHSVFVTGIPIAGTSSDSASVSIFNIPTEIAAALSIAYLVLLAFLMTRLTFAIARTLRVHTSSLVPVDEAIAAFTKHASGILKIKRKVTVWIGKNISVPATIGFFKPIILLPAVCLTHLTPQQIEAIILHELSHIRRNDFLLNLVLVVIETILFFNPAVFFFMKTIREERENCCDDLVLSNNYEPRHYARALLTFSKEQAAHQKLAMNAASRKHQLLYRIKRITGGDLERPVHFSGRIIVFALVALLLFSFAIFTNRHQSKIATTTPSLVKTISTTTEIEHFTGPQDFSQNILAVKKKINLAPKEKSVLKDTVQAPLQLPDLKDISKEIQFVTGHSLTTPYPADKKFSDQFEKETSVQLQHALKQISEAKLASLFDQKKVEQEGIWSEKELAYLQQFRNKYDQQLEKLMVSGDSILLQTNRANDNLREIILKGKKRLNAIGSPQIIVSPDGNKKVNLRIVKGLRTADI